LVKLQVMDNILVRQSSVKERKAGMVTVLSEVMESRSGKTVFGDRKDCQLGETVLLLKERTSILVK